MMFYKTECDKIAKERLKLMMESDALENSTNDIDFKVFISQKNPVY